MTLEEIKCSDKLFLTAVDIAPVLGACPDTIRDQAHENPEYLGFPVSVMGKMVRIPRIPFIYFVEGKP